MTNADPLRQKSPDLVADIWLYPTEKGGRKTPAPLGWGCPLKVSKTETRQGWDVRFLLGDKPLPPGGRRRVGLVFLTAEGCQTIKDAGQFFLWEAGIIGEGVVIAGK